MNKDHLSAVLDYLLWEYASDLNEAKEFAISLHEEIQKRKLAKGETPIPSLEAFGLK